MPDRFSDVDDIVIIVVVILEIFAIREIREIPTGELPFDERLQEIISDQEVLETVKQQVEDAQREGRALPLPSARELAAIRERVLEKLQQTP
jgi:hypothetical protein